jgi:hypothetical protein
MLQRYLLFLFMIIAPALLKAQELFQNIRGTVLTANGLPVPGAAVILAGESSPGASTDSSGRFRISHVPVGRHALDIRALGFKAQLLPGLVVDAGKETVIEIKLEESAQSLKEVEISAYRSQSDEPGTRTFTVEETKRFAATFYDPARLAASFPGVVSDNDQANNIVIRGNSPNGVLWRLEGLDIVNPNHLDNAGTFSDRAAANGGGVNILSAQLLGNSKLITGTFPSSYGNALSGVLDMRLRKGNNEHNEFTGQVSLLGTDLAAEGPFTKNKNSSYLVNYRYSTIGLLSAMGLDLGDEITTFQDLSFHLSFPTAKAGSFTLFGMGGSSSTLFNAQMDSTVWQYSRDRYDVDFHSKTGAVGFTHSHSLNSNIFMRTAIGISSKLVTRTGSWIDNSYNLHTLQEDKNSQSKISAHSYMLYSINSSNTLTAGVNLNDVMYDVYCSEGAENTSPRTIFSGQGQYILAQPYISWKSVLGKKLMLNTGLHYMYLSLNGSDAIEPRASLTYDLQKDRSISLAYGMHSQVQQPGIYFTSTESEGTLHYPNKDLGFTKAHHYSAAYSFNLLKDVHAKLEGYYQYLFDVPVSSNTASTFSTLNMFESFGADSLVNKGTGRNYGIELTIEKMLADRYYFLLSSAVYNSRYTAADGIEHDTRYNGKYAFSFSGGKEIVRSRNRVLGINTRIIYRGGYKETPVNELLSEATAQTVFMNGSPYSLRQKDYFRIDIGISSKKQKRGYTRTFALDIQNVSNTKNESYRYYDTLRKEVVTKYQLGIIPVLSYRVEFGSKKDQ